MSCEYSWNVDEENADLDVVAEHNFAEPKRFREEKKCNAFLSINQSQACVS